MFGVEPVPLTSMLRVQYAGCLPAGDVTVAWHIAMVTLEMLSALKLYILIKGIGQNSVLATIYHVCHTKLFSVFGLGFLILVRLIWKLLTKNNSGRDEAIDQFPVPMLKTDDKWASSGLKTDTVVS